MEVQVSVAVRAAAPIASEKILAVHPGGTESIQFAEAAAHRGQELRRRVDASMERSRNLRRLPTEPLFIVPTVMALIHLILF